MKPDSFEHRVGGMFQPLPEVYQIEVTNACNLKCPMCLRTTDMLRKSNLLDLDLLKTMNERGDFDGSYYIELQLAGEPTLHPKLEEIVDYLKTEVGVMVGLSTHGLLMDKPRVQRALAKVDALTISVDSVVPETYAKFRPPAKLEDLYRCIDSLFAYFDEWFTYERLQTHKLPFVELQMIDAARIRGKAASLDGLVEVSEERGWDKYASCRMQGDCFIEMQDGEKQQANEDLCINPYMSVSIACNGDVLSCCYIFEPSKTQPNVYGNLNDASLLEIWNGRQANDMRDKTQKGCPEGACTKCYLKSPSRIHMNILSRLLRWQKSQTLELAQIRKEANE